ncbi:hypothetical protein HQ865_20975 [Mucilaginibacter mali]|uniref:Uncharacterized protein n=1 Tax=Mucilaginibacter mali TaxID=2740462 RepID=A0A7D4QHP1_9SPHI|nr:hypothetical protein [Mucilaginibacter mali]QKJ32132.1 hypothetical protein HQ865_20975 [Mucilaginibacter mali]
MKTRFLFPAFFRIIGCLMALPGFVLGYLVVYKNFEMPGFGLKVREQSTFLQGTFENFTNELALTLVIAGLMFIAFSKVKKEDEMTGKIRLNALYWAIPVNYLWYAFFIILSALNIQVKSPAINTLLDPFSNEDGYLVFNLFMPLLIFIVRFYYLLSRNAKGRPVAGIHLLKHMPFSALGKGLSFIITLLVIISQVFVKSDLLESMYWFLPLTLMIWVYAKEKVEDEYINHLRLDALQIAVYANYAILLLSNFMFYGVSFLLIQIFNLATIPLIFIIRFQYRLYRLRRSEAKSLLTLSL